MKAENTITHTFTKVILLVALFTATGCVAEKQALTGNTQSANNGSLVKNQLSGEQLHALLSDGIELKLGGPSEGYHGQLSLSKDGTGEGWAITDTGRKININGTWEIRNNAFCRTWAEVNSGMTVCEKWITIADNAVEVHANKKRIGVNSWE